MRRRIPALIAIFALVFSQLAVSAFACPLDVNAPAAMAAMDSEHCDRAPTQNLCDRHCDYGAANVNHAAPDVAPDVLALPLPWRAAPVPVAACIARAPVATPARSHSPPALTLFGVLRI